MFPDDCLPPRIYGDDGFCRYGTEPLRNSLRADVVGRDQRDELFDGSKLMCPFPDCRGCFGRVSVAPVRVQPRVSKIMRPAWPNTRRLVAAVSIMNGPSASVLQAAIHSSMMARVCSGAETGSLPKPCMTSGSLNRS
jgi:hypothetical protein